MHELVEVSPADLILDAKNARLGEEQPSQPATTVALAKAVGGKALLTLCADIVEHGLDPISPLAVVATGDRKQKYVAIEGNRRVLALKVLDAWTARREGVALP